MEEVLCRRKKEDFELERLQEGRDKSSLTEVNSFFGVSAQHSTKKIGEVDACARRNSERKGSMCEDDRGKNSEGGDKEH